MGQPKRKPQTPAANSPKRSRRGSSSDSEDNEVAPPNPACPGVVKPREPGPLSQIAPGSDLLEAFISLRENRGLTNEQALLEFLETYDDALSAISQVIIQKRLDVSFSNVKYEQVAPYVSLDPRAAGRDIKPLQIFRSRLPKDLCHKIYVGVNEAFQMYGPFPSHDTEEAKSRVIAPLFTTIVNLFGSTILNKPEGLIEGEFTRDSRIEHQFIALDTISVVFIEVKTKLATGKERLNVKAQVLAEAAGMLEPPPHSCFRRLYCLLISTACDRANRNQGFWVPILAILCDGRDFEYIVFDSVDKVVYSSGWIAGLNASGQVNQGDLLRSLQKITEYLFDWFIMGYINAIRAVWCKSKHKKRESTEKWSSALHAAEKSHFRLRQAAETAIKKDYTSAEELAVSGIDQLKLSVSELPFNKPYDVDSTQFWDGKHCIEEHLADLDF